MVYFIGTLTKEQIIDLVYKMLTLNEQGNASKYNLAKINIGNSGYTFGVCQHDCGQRLDAREFIANCLKKVGASAEEIDKIMHILTDNTKNLNPDQLDRVNNALSDNVAAVDKFDSDFIKASVDYVKGIVNSSLGRPDSEGDQVTGIIAQSLIHTTPLIFLQLVDYNNQFGLESTGPLIKFLNGIPVNRSDLGPGKVATTDRDKVRRDLLGEIRRFINEYTKYGLEHPKDCSRRQQNIDNLPMPNRIPQNPTPNPTPDPTPNPTPSVHRLHPGNEPGGLIGDPDALFPPPAPPRPYSCSQCTE